jgi:hypothetical protein
MGGAGWSLTSAGATVAWRAHFFEVQNGFVVELHGFVNKRSK